MDTPRPNLAREIGALLRSSRLLKNLTQAQLAQRANLSERALRKLEEGENVGLASFLAVATELGYAGDLRVILGKDKPTTFDQHQALAVEKHKRRRRAR